MRLSLNQTQPDHQQGSTLHAVPTAAYVHLPFCRRRCYYCDFPISVVGDRPPLASRAAQGFGTIAEYIEILVQEIRATVPAGQPLQTVFFGGGTPSLLTVEQLAQVLTVLDQQFGIAANAEISMEIDPDTFDRERLQGYFSAGVNRVSLGVQAFQTELLQACGRTHTRADVETAIGLIYQVGFSNFSLDLISGLPHQTLDHWQESLALAIALAPTHLSVYDLTVEPGTAFDRWYQPGSQPLPTEATTAQMYRLAQPTLTQAGFQHYEISNYAKPGYQCRHNRVYWQNRPYYGFGMGAASYLNRQRFTRPRKRQAYYDWVQTFAQTGEIDCPVTPDAEVLLDTLMLGLRLAEGLSLKQLTNQFGQETIAQVLQCLQPYQQKGWVLHAPNFQSGDLDDQTLDSRIRLSDPDGFLFSNVVLTALFEWFT
ncbi:MAG: coproporphyrinogen III oxidase [Cyanobacteria bacterium RM1_2_2]|nr:coproporphyrinogen III oxidase [Cyanobacteria bacterium RM1_2_2]